MERIIKEDTLYKHFKGPLYKVLYIASHSETLEKLVVYEDSNKKIWVRPYNMFNSLVDIKKYPKANQKYRFEEVK